MSYLVLKKLFLLLSLLKRVFVEYVVENVEPCITPVTALLSWRNKYVIIK